VKHRTSAGVPVSRETIERLDAYAHLLLRWNAKINLISRGDEPRLAERHIDDALQLAPLMPPNISTAVDLGSGGGLPGLILAIATGAHFHLVEADKRKAAFLREAARVTAAPVTIHNQRVEAAMLAPAPLITARAFAPLPRLLELAHRLLMPTSILLLPKGESADRELTEAAAGWNMKMQKFPSKTDPGATILRLSEVTRV
jgi:16S rRNA (guanine527-N7)-methyltransferase